MVEFKHIQIAIVALVIVILVSAVVGARLPNNLELSATVLKSALAEITNKNRIASNVSNLQINPLLEQAALLKAQDMAQKEYFSHTSPDGKSPWHWLEKVGYQYKYAGENLAVNFFDSEDVAQAWMNSPTHKENMINKNYTEMGFGLARGSYKGHETVFVVQFFGTPLFATENISANVINTQPKIETSQKSLRKTIFKMWRGNPEVPTDNLNASVINSL